MCEECLKNIQYEHLQPTCGQCKMAKTPSEMNEDGNCYACLFPEDAVSVKKHSKQSNLKDSKLSKLSASQFPNLIGKLQSKISKEERE